jgi:peptidyl-Asp metalloendopeptidase
VSPSDGRRNTAWNIAAAADFSGDRKSDLVWQRLSDGLVEIQFLNGIQPVGGGLILNSPFDNSWQVAGAGDFNGDGRADLVYRRPSDGLTELQFLNGLTPVGGGAIANNPFDNSWQIAGIGDFNGDGRSDLVYRRTDGLTEIQFLNGTNAVGGGVIAGNPFDSSWQIVGTGDFNGDGTADLIYHRASDGLTEVQLLHGTTVIGGGPLA